MIGTYFNIAIKNLLARKTRSILTFIGIFIAIFTIFVLLSLSLGLKEVVDEQFELLGKDKIFIMPKGQLGAPGSSGGSVELTINDVEELRKISELKTIGYFNAGNVTLDLLSFSFDECSVIDNNLTEFFCYFNGTEFEIRNESFNCTGVCVGGACHDCFSIVDCFSYANIQKLFVFGYADSQIIRLICTGVFPAPTVSFYHIGLFPSQLAWPIILFLQLVDLLPRRLSEPL